MVARSVALLLVVGVALLHTGAAWSQYPQPERNSGYPQQQTNSGYPQQQTNSGYPQQQTNNYPHQTQQYDGSPKTLRPWGQCGGTVGECYPQGQSYRQGLAQCEDKQWSGVVCPSGQKCNRQSQYYWQCLPYGESFNKNNNYPQQQTNNYPQQQTNNYPQQQTNNYPQPKPQPQQYPQPQPQQYPQPKPQPPPQYPQPQPQPQPQYPYQQQPVYGRL